MKPLVILELANNHMGELAQGIAVVRAFAVAVAPYSHAFEFAFKLQYRDLDTYIHPNFRGREDVKYVKRFEETRLRDDEFRQLISAMVQNGFATACTPFDEPSVARIEAHGIGRIKIGSCSLTDWPLLERIAAAGKPVIASTAGYTLEEIDAAASFFLHRSIDLTLLHCVAEYPTPDARLAVNQVKLLAARYPGIRVGFSTHERPEQTEAVMLALAAGATVFEKHVGLPTAKYSNNAYSVSPDELSGWLAAGARALEMLGVVERYVPSESERSGLHALRRGVFVKRDLGVGAQLTAGDVFFAFPTSPGQLTANDWSKYLTHTLSAPLTANAAVMAGSVRTGDQREHVVAAVEAVRVLLRAANVVLPGKSELEISHHYGMEKFGEFGLTMITVVNRAYCKKVLALLPGQRHPEQYHEAKEETFVVLHGTMRLRLDGVEQIASAGDVVTVERGVRHEFYSEGGVVFEEISSTHQSNDSFYTDPAIGQNAKRKTLLAYWM